MIEGLNSAGRSFCTFAGAMFIQSAVLVAVLFVADWLLRKRVKATFRYWLWMLVFVKLILPPGLSSPASLGYWYHDWVAKGHPAPLTVVTIPAEKASPQVEPVGSALAHADSTPAPVSVEPAPAPVPSVPNAPVVSPRVSLSRQGTLFLLWLVGVLILTLLLLQRVCFVRGLIAQSRPVEESLIRLLDECREQMHIRRSVGLRLSPVMFSPAVCGLFHPVILLPEALLTKLSHDDLRAVLIHELAHAKRGDLWLNSVQTLLQIAYFYNPFVWLAGVMVRRVREQAVDEMVLVALGAEAKSYSRTLVDIAEMAFFKPTWTLRLIGVAESKKSLEGRIKHMLTRPIPKNARLGLSGLIGVLIAATLLLPMARGAARRDSQTPSGEPVPDKNTEIAVVRWIAFSGPELDKDIRSIAKPLETASKSCQCLTCDANELTAVVRCAMQTRKDVGLDRYVRWLLPTSGSRRMTGGSSGGVSAPLAPWGGASCSIQHSYTLDTNGGAARFDLDSQYMIRTAKSDLRVAGEMRFNGEIAPGKAMVFLGDVKQDEQSKASYIIVWQAVAVPPGVVMDRGPNRNQYYTSDWIERGPGEAMKLPVSPVRGISACPPAEPGLEANDVTLMVGQWMVLVEPSLAKEIRSISQPASTASVAYECLTCSGDALAGVVRQWLQAGRTIESSGRLQWLSENSGRGSIGPNGWPATLKRVSAGLLVDAALQGPYRLNTGGDTAKLGLEYQALCRWVRGEETAEIRGSILFTGDVAPGKAIVFLGDLKQDGQSKAMQVAVWQAIKVPARLVPYLNAMATGQNWIDAGTSGGLKSAQESLDLNARLPTTRTPEASSKWTRTLPDGRR